MIRFRSVGFCMEVSLLYFCNMHYSVCSLMHFLSTKAPCALFVYTVIADTPHMCILHMHIRYALSFLKKLAMHSACWLCVYSIRFVYGIFVYALCIYQYIYIVYIHCAYALYKCTLFMHSNSLQANRFSASSQDSELGMLRIVVYVAL